jgi:DNA-binding response OmpR family regulator
MVMTVHLAGPVTAEPAAMLAEELRRHGFEIAGPGTRADVVLAGGTAELERLCAEAPVIVLGGADDRPDESVLAFRRGCDDYVRGPFSGDELVERIRAVARRGRRPPPSRIFRAGSLELDESARLVTVSGMPVKLSQKEFDLLAHLASDPERVFTRAELLRDIWHWPPRMHTRTLDSHASRLRRKLRALDRETAFVDNEWGVGYRLIGVYADSLGG